MNSLLTRSKSSPELDPAFQSTALVLQAIKARANGIPVDIAVVQSDGSVFRKVFHLSPGLSPEVTANNQLLLMHLVRSALWIYGGNQVHIYGAPPDVGNWLEHFHYRLNRIGLFDADVMARRVYGGEFEVRLHETGRHMPVAKQTDLPVRLGAKGCYIGFDLGGSNRRGVAIIDGKVVHQEDIPWSPYGEPDPEYHYRGILATLKAAAAKLPRVDGIGGSAAGIYVNNRPRIASLFKGVPDQVFRTRVVPIFDELRREMGGVPFFVVNDGAVAALSASENCSGKRILSLALGTSTGGGFVTQLGHVTSQLDELAFVPIAIQPEALLDDWSGFPGCASRYLSQQAIPVLAAAAGLKLDGATVPEQLKSLQAIMKQTGEERAKAEKIYRTIGAHLGFAIAWFYPFYDMEVVYLTGRVVEGPGGNLIVSEASRVINADFPAISEKCMLVRATDEAANFGQTVTAAYLASK